MSLLRESGTASGETYDLTAIVAGDGARSGVPHGAELIEFVDAMHSGMPGRLAAARQALQTTVGDAAFVDVCAVAASFNAVVKLADGTGIPLEDAKEERTRDFRGTLGIEDFRR